MISKSMKSFSLTALALLMLVSQVLATEGCSRCKNKKRECEVAQIDSNCWCCKECIEKDLREADEKGKEEKIKNKERGRLARWWHSNWKCFECRSRDRTVQMRGYTYGQSVVICYRCLHSRYERSWAPNFSRGDIIKCELTNSAADANEQLPDGWTEHIDSESRIYYRKKGRSKSQWKRPSHYLDAAVVQAVPFQVVYLDTNHNQKMEKIFSGAKVLTSEWLCWENERGDSVFIGKYYAEDESTCEKTEWDCPDCNGTGLDGKRSCGMGCKNGTVPKCLSDDDLKRVLTWKSPLDEYDMDQRRRLCTSFQHLRRLMNL